MGTVKTIVYNIPNDRIHRKNLIIKTEDTISESLLLLFLYIEISFVAVIRNPKSIRIPKYEAMTWAKITLPYISVPRIYTRYGYVIIGNNRLNTCKKDR